MQQYSDMVILIWHIAATEAYALKHEFIEKEHLFIGLCRAHEFSSDDVTKILSKDVPKNSIEKELRPVLDSFKICSIDYKGLRRYIRGSLGKGEFEPKMEVPIHRSEECRQYFHNAEELARSANEGFVYPIHLYKAILLDPGHHIEKVLGAFGLKRDRVLGFLNDKRPAEQPMKKVADFRYEKSAQCQGATPFLDRFCVDLTAQARMGLLKPLIGRRSESLQVVRTLLLREKNNPILVGEAGVGKTAIVEDLARRIVSGNLHPDLRGKRILQLDLTGLVSNTKYRGDFEARIHNIIKEAQAHPEIILFVDEIHTLVGAGNAEGAQDAANIMKPLLTRGAISVIGATTLDEYNRFIAKDRALERRFQSIIVKEPDPDETLKILEGLKERFEQHHCVRVEMSALKVLVELSTRYLPYRRMPDKALDVLDKACARVRAAVLSYHLISDGTEHDLDDIQTGGRYSQPLTVNTNTIAEVITEETGVPVGTIREDEARKLKKLNEILSSRVLGQKEVIEKIVHVVRLNRSGLKDLDRPVGVFLFLGPSGVGKTELSKALAEALFGSEDEIIRLDMSEYKEKQGVAKLIGAPPGYIGYEQEGQLTGALRRKPYSVVLFDEIEKAHPDIFDIFLQLFDEGRITDAKGQTVNAKNSIFILTSNIGTDLLYREPIGFVDPKNGNCQDVMENIHRRLNQTFRTEFLNRLDEMLFFNHLGMDTILKLTQKKIDYLKNILRNKRKILFDISDSAIQFIAQRGYDPRFGARQLERAIQALVIIPISEKIHNNEIGSGRNVTLDTEGDNLVYRSNFETQ